MYTTTHDALTCSFEGIIYSGIPNAETQAELQSMATPGGYPQRAAEFHHWAGHLHKTLGMFCEEASWLYLRTCT